MKKHRTGGKIEQHKAPGVRTYNIELIIEIEFNFVILVAVSLGAFKVTIANTEEEASGDVHVTTKREISAAAKYGNKNQTSTEVQKSIIKTTPIRKIPINNKENGLDTHES